MKVKHFFTLLFLGLIALPALSADVGLPEIQLPEKISGANVLVLYKKLSSNSKKIATYYAQQRKIPSSNLISVPILSKSGQINQQKFESIYQHISPQLTPEIKVIVLAWHAPYRVECMSITSAFALGFDRQYCSHSSEDISGCHKTTNSAYFNNASSLLWQQDPPLKLSMMLSGETFSQAKELIDRGIRADNSHPDGHAYLVRTHDHSRSTRWPIFKQFADIWSENKSGVTIHYVDDRVNEKSSSIQNKTDIMFYHTGLKHVPAIETNTYLPGAIADHLTSGAGIGIEHAGQMKVFRWLESGVTASYGAVEEPCNYIEKFPNPQILIPAYLDGDSLVEAYWKSVQQPGEGLFVGEPLARPWSKTQVVFEGDSLIIFSRELEQKKSYYIESQLAESSEWQVVKAQFIWKDGVLKIITPKTKSERYRIVEQQE